MSCHPCQKVAPTPLEFSNAKRGTIEAIIAIIQYEKKVR